MRLGQEFVSRRLCTVYAGDGVPREDLVSLVCKVKRRPLAPPCCCQCAASGSATDPPAVCVECLIFKVTGIQPLTAQLHQQGVGGFFITVNTMDVH